ncbi:MAG: hypothetical protein AAF108_02510 [Planctomycetota bacterium]
MHALTKIFAVMATVLALVVATLASFQSLNAGKIRGEFENIQTRQRANEASLQSQATEESEQITSLRVERQALTDEITQLRTDLTELENEKIQAEARERKAVADAVQVTRQIGQLAQTVETQQALIASYREEVQDLRAGELAFRKREIDLVDRLNDLESQNGVLDQTVRALQVELADLQGRIAQGNGGTGDEGIVEIFGDPITGEVVRVRDDAGRQIAQIDLGSRDRMRNRARLYILRGKDFLAQLILEDVDLDSAVGVVDTLGEAISIRPGDTVVTSLETGTGG